MKILICGSMSASKEMIEAGKELEKLGHETALPEFTHEYAKLKTIGEMHVESAHYKVKYDLIRGYYDKIKSGDAILVLNIDRNGVEGYIGGNSFLEMGFAHILNKPIFLLNKVPEMGYKDEMVAMEPIVIFGDYKKIE